jgi:hypothetical protein
MVNSEATLALFERPVLFALGIMLPQVSIPWERLAVPTVTGEDWFPYFRFYGPQQALFTKTWKLRDIEKVS